MTQAAESSIHINGIDVEALQAIVHEVEKDPAKGMVSFRVTTDWEGQTLTTSKVDSYTIGGEEVKRSFSLTTDEPLELLGTNSAPNPQELLMSALNACVTVGYVAGAAVHGITLESLEIETEGKLDLRGFLGIDESVRAGYESLRYTVRIKGDGTPEQFRAIHEHVMKTSPNYFNLARPVRLEAELQVG